MGAGGAASRRRVLAAAVGGAGVGADGRRAAHRRRRRGRAHERSGGRPRSGSGALDRIEAPDRLDRRPAGGGRHRERGADDAGGCGRGSEPARHRTVRPDLVRVGRTGYRAAGVRTARCHDRRPAVPGSDRGGVRPVQRGVEHDRLRAHSPRRHPAPHGRGAAARSRAPDRPRSLHERHAHRGRGGRSRGAQGGQPSRPPPGDHQRQRPAVRPGPRRRPPGDRRLERRRRRPPLVEQRLRQQPHRRPAHAGARPPRRVRPHLGGAAPRRRDARSRARSCPPGRTG